MCSSYSRIGTACDAQLQNVTPFRLPPFPAGSVASSRVICEMIIAAGRRFNRRNHCALCLGFWAGNRFSGWFDRESAQLPPNSNSCWCVRIVHRSLPAVSKTISVRARARSLSTWRNRNPGRSTVIASCPIRWLSVVSFSDISGTQICLPFFCVCSLNHRYCTHTHRQMGRTCMGVGRSRYQMADVCVCGALAFTISIIGQVTTTWPLSRCPRRDAV